MAAQVGTGTERIEAYFHKSNFFRVVLAEGCFGGVTPRGMIHCSFFSERSAIPLRVAIPIQDGHPGPEETLESKPGLVRELEVDVVMDLATAISFNAWLQAKIEVLSASLGVSQDDVRKASTVAKR